MNNLPVVITHTGVPPIKCQGIKTKLVPFISRSLFWSPNDKGRWIEPFLGSGVVALNLAPNRALLADTNKHIIGFYTAIQKGELPRDVICDFLMEEGKKLELNGAEYYYEVRERFNKSASPLDFLFLNRSCFNGVMRFNKNGEFNVPFGHKPFRFTKSFITKVINQISWVAKQIREKDWEFRVQTWDATLADATPDDFVYMDPPYIGRHTDYYNSWNEYEAEKLAVVSQNLPCGFAVSMWLENRHRRNEHIDKCWSNLETRLCRHFYHVGSTEELRNEMVEALLIRPEFATPDDYQKTIAQKNIPNQLTLLAG